MPRVSRLAEKGGCMASVGAARTRGPHPSPDKRERSNGGDGQGTPPLRIHVATHRDGLAASVFREDDRIL